ncbi:MAG: long-chain fatty acid--CoA ligase [Actinomyces succiniciruminis]|nr:long-chain fatty acid--CoA ligase [Actinomyces succiniciruminis]
MSTGVEEPFAESREQGRFTPGTEFTVAAPHSGPATVFRALPDGRPETRSPVQVPLEFCMTTPWALARRARATPDLPLVAYHAEGSADWREQDAAAFRARVRQVAAGYIAQGLQAGDRIAIMSHTRYEWMLLDFAAWEAGLVSVPIYETSSPAQARWILTDAGVRLVVAETAPMTDMLCSLARDVPELSGLTVLSLQQDAIGRLIAAGAQLPASAVDARADALTADDLATIVYTSGTTGSPKGTELTHGNLVHLSLNSIEFLPQIIRDGAVRNFLFLPMAHVLGRYIMVAIVCSPHGVIGLSPDTRHLLEDFAAFKPTFFLAVPRVFEKIFNAADTRATGARHLVFRRAVRVAVAYSRALDAPGGPSAVLRARRALYTPLVYNRLRRLFGGAIEYVICGGGPLGEELGHFFRGAGVTILEGYGLTETAAPCTLNPPDGQHIGTVGVPLTGSAVRIAADGEILISGVGLFRAYHNNPEATAAAFADDEPAWPGLPPEHWFRSGDLGTIDAEGLLHITGRKKELIVTAGGKNVSPAVLEDRLGRHPLIDQVLVVGDGRPCIGALITLDAEMLPLWLHHQGLAEMTPAQAAQDPHVHQVIADAVADANRAVSRAESIRTFTVLPGDFTVANGLLTPSLKIRREVALKRFAPEIDALYARP